MFGVGFDRFKDKCSRERAGQARPNFVAEPYDWASEVLLLNLQLDQQNFVAEPYDWASNVYC